MPSQAPGAKRILLPASCSSSGSGHGSSPCQARIAERQAHASVWPYLSIGYTVNDVGESRNLSPSVRLASLTDTGATVASTGTNTDGGSCTCNAQHAIFPLGASFDCATATVEQR